MPATKMKGALTPEQITPGMRVRYWPVIGRDLCYLGTVDGEPWELGGRIVVALAEMTSFNGGTNTREAAACIGHMRRPDVGAVS